MKKKSEKELTKTEIPLDIALPLLKPDELAKLKRYVIAYFAEYGNEEQKKKYGALLG